MAAVEVDKVEGLEFGAVEFVGHGVARGGAEVAAEQPAEEAGGDAPFPPVGVRPDGAGEDARGNGEILHPGGATHDVGASKRLQKKRVKNRHGLHLERQKAEAAREEDVVEWGHSDSVESEGTGAMG